MATQNRLWGAERIRGELLKLGMHVCKRTIQKYMRTVRTPRPRGQRWATFLHNHAAQIWACDFIQVTDLFFRPLFAFFNTPLKSRKVIHVGVTRSPTDPWVAQHLREATPYGQAPKYLTRDNDNKFGPCVAEKGGYGTLEERWKAEIGQEVRASWSNQTSPIQIRAAILVGGRGASVRSLMRWEP